MRIIAATVLCVDFFPASGQVLVGGNSLNFATQCRRCGVRDVSVLGAVGDDSFGEAILTHLRDHAIESSHVYVHRGATASNKIYISPEGDRYFKPDSWTGGVYQTFHLSSSDWEFVNTFDLLAIPTNNPNFQEALTRRQDRCQTIVDFLDERDVGFIEATLARVDVGVVSGNEEMVAYFDRITNRLSNVLIVTLGAEGSVAFHHNRRYRRPAIPVPQVVDTTGCGDAFQAAFAVAWFQNHGMEASLKQGAEAAAKVLGKLGGA